MDVFSFHYNVHSVGHFWAIICGFKQQMTKFMNQVGHELYMWMN